MRQVFFASKFDFVFPAALKFCVLKRIRGCGNTKWIRHFGGLFHIGDDVGSKLLIVS